MAILLSELELETCPYCGVDHPNLSSLGKDVIRTTNYVGKTHASGEYTFAKDAVDL